MSERIDFSEKTKTIIAKRAGYQCSFPECNKILVGPGSASDEFIELGECAHIFAAAVNGPRNRGSLSNEDLKRAENGIFLCREHHKIIDAKETEYTSELLLQYKSKHEFQISAQIGEYFYPTTWIKQLTVNDSPNMIKDKIIELGKLTLLYGKNGCGKSTIIEIIYEIFSQKILSRWNDENFKMTIKMDNPLIKEFCISINDNTIIYTSNNRQLPFIPYDMKVVFIKDKEQTYKEGKDDLKNIANYLNVDRNFVKAMINSTGIIDGLRTKKISIEHIRSTPYLVDKLKVCLNDRRERAYCSYSSTEKYTIVLDLVLSYLTQISKYKPTLFLMDWSDFNSIDDCMKKKYLDFLQASSSHFQSIITTHTLWNIEWTGWQIINL